MATGTETTLGDAFARALSRRDFDAIERLLHPEIEFVGLTPGRTWPAAGPREVIDDVLAHWFEPEDEIESLLDVQTDAFADRERVGYRLQGRNPDGPFVVEQQAYYTPRDGRIAWMRVMCSGFRPR